MWTPHEIRKLISQIAGLLFAGAGVWLLIDGVQASGTIDITSEILSGKIESGSAGLFLLFLGFILILFPSLFGSKVLLKNTNVLVSESEHSSLEKIKKASLSETTRAGIVGIGLVVTSVCLLFFANYLVSVLKMNVGIFFGVAGFVSGLVGAIILLIFLINWISPDALPKNETNK